MENRHKETLRRKFLNQAAKYQAESRKLHDYLPDFDQSPDEMTQWYAVQEHKIHIKNQIQYLELLYTDLTKTWKELSNLPKSKGEGKSTD